MTERKVKGATKAGKSSSGTSDPLVKSLAAVSLAACKPALALRVGGTSVGNLLISLVPYDYLQVNFIVADELRYSLRSLSGTSAVKVCSETFIIGRAFSQAGTIRL